MFIYIFLIAFLATLSWFTIKNYIGLGNLANLG